MQQLQADISPTSEHFDGGTIFVMSCLVRHLVVSLCLPGIHARSCGYSYKSRLFHLSIRMVHELLVLEVTLLCLLLAVGGAIYIHESSATFSGNVRLDHNTADFAGKSASPLTTNVCFRILGYALRCMEGINPYKVEAGESTVTREYYRLNYLIAHAMLL